MIKRSIKNILCCLTAAITILLFASLPSSVAGAYSLSTPTLSAPVNTAQGVKISWGKVRSAAKYRVYLKSGSSWKKLADTASNSYLHTKAVSGTKYTYTVCCISANGKQILSGKNNAGKSIVYIKAPAVTGAVNDTNGVRIAWSASNGAAKYRVYLKNGSAWKKLADVKTNTYTHTAAVSGKSYTYAVRCLAADAKSFTSALGAAKSITYVKMPSVSGFSDTLSGTKISWNPIAGASKFRIYIKNGSGWKNIADTTATSYTHFANNNTSYTYTIRCLNAAGNPVSAYSTKGWTHTYTMPETSLDAPSIVDFASAENGLVIRWNPVQGAQKYLVMVKNNGFWDILGRTANTSYTYTKAASGVSCSYTVCCVTEDGKSYASLYNERGKTFTYVQAPVISKLSNTAFGPLIEWNRVNGAAKYNVLTLDENGEWITLAETTECAFVDTQAMDSKSCTYTVCSLNAAGNPVSEFLKDGKSILCHQNPSAPVYTRSLFADDAETILGQTLMIPTDSNAPLTRRNASEILVKVLGYGMMSNVTLSDSSDKYLLTAAYYGYFTPDSLDRIFPDKRITAAEYATLLNEITRYARLKGKRVLAFGDSIMYGSGNHISGSRYGGIVHMISEKYGMTYRSFAVCGATFGIRNDVDHIPEQIYKAYLSGFKPDVILLDGGTNDMKYVYRGNTQDSFNASKPENSTFAYGMNSTLTQINRYWSGIPVVYIRVHNMNICDDTLERQIGEYGVKLAESAKAAAVDIYKTASLNTEKTAMRDRYTKYNADLKAHDGVHPNALAYATFYLPAVGEKIASLLIP